MLRMMYPDLYQLALLHNRIQESVCSINICITAKTPKRLDPSGSDDAMSCIYEIKADQSQINCRDLICIDPDDH